MAKSNGGKSCTRLISRAMGYTGRGIVTDTVITKGSEVEILLVMFFVVCRVVRLLLYARLESSKRDNGMRRQTIEVEQINGRRRQQKSNAPPLE